MMSIRSIRTGGAWRAVRRALVAAVCLHGVSLSAQRAEERREGGYRERMAYWASTRGSPKANVTPEDIARVRELRTSLAAGQFPGQTLAARWQPIGPAGFISMNTGYSSAPMTDEGRFATIAVHPRDPRILYAGAASAGIWRSDNSGASWVAIADDQCGNSIGSIAIDPVDPRIVYAGTGEATTELSGGAYPPGFTDGCGVLRSTNGGESWTRLGATVFSLPGAEGAAIYKLTIDRVTAGSPSTTTIFAGSDIGLMRSVDAGQSWTRVLVGAITDIKQHPTRPEIFYAAGGSTRGALENGVYRSLDRGVSWTRISAPLGNPLTLSRIELAVSPARPGSVWALAAAASDFKFGLLARFDEGPGQWSLQSATGVINNDEYGDFGEQSHYNLCIAVDPEDANRIIIGGVRLFRSADGGRTFRPIAANVHSDWHNVVYDPSDSRRVYAALDGGLYTSSNGGDGWRSLNNGISATQFFPGFAVHPTNPGIVVGGTQDNGSMISNGGSPFWQGLGFGDGGYAVMDYTAPNNLLVSWQNGQLARVDLAARSVEPLRARLPGRPPFITPFVIDPESPRIVYGGTQGVVRSTDFGATWAPMSPVINGNITSIAISRGVPKVIVAGANTGFVALTRDGGATWLSGELFNRSISDIAADPNINGRFGIVFSGFGSTRVAITRDALVTGSNITGNLPNIPMNAIVFTPTADRIFVGSDIGVFETLDGGRTWALTLGMPAVAVTDLWFHAATNRLVASTYGRGIWTYPLSTPAGVLRGDVDRNGIVNAADALLVQQTLAGIRVPSQLTAMPHGDANCSGSLDAADALIILRFAVGLGTGGSCVNTVQ
jgi:hypothetical protein